jgi:hypothetical protein
LIVDAEEAQPGRKTTSSKTQEPRQNSDEFSETRLRLQLIVIARHQNTGIDNLQF